MTGLHLISQSCDHVEYRPRIAPSLITLECSSVAKNFHGSSDICLMGFICSIQICEISHQTFGPSHRKCPTCPMIFVNTDVEYWKNETPMKGTIRNMCCALFYCLCYGWISTSLVSFVITPLALRQSCNSVMSSLWSSDDVWQRSLGQHWLR